MIKELDREELIKEEFVQESSNKGLIRKELGQELIRELGSATRVVRVQTKEREGEQLPLGN